MATSSFIEALIGGVEPGLKKTFKAIFDYVLVNLRLGRPTHQQRAENLQLYFLVGTTHATPNTEFSIAHGLASAPYLLVPMLDLQAVGAQIVPLTVSRAADATRIYLKSSVASAPICCLVEAS